jgi:hypothetical protein
MNTIPRPRILLVAPAVREERAPSSSSAWPSSEAAASRRFTLHGLSTRAMPVILAWSVVGMTTGCTSALTSAYLRAMPWETAEHAAESEPATDADATSGDDAPADAPAVTDDDGDDRRAAAIDEAVSRLARLGTLDEAAAASLVATLRVTQQQDWPVVIAEFAAALDAATTTTEVPDSAGDAGTVPDDALSAAAATPPHVVAKADLTPTVAVSVAGVSPPAQPRAIDATPTPAATAVTPSAPPNPAPPSPTPAAVAGETEPSAAPTPAFRVANACFASRVQAWGVVDRFPTDRFRAGREVIVYFELDELSAQATAAGHTTCIDTVLRLVDDRGTTVREWNFEPLAETCAGRRRDYFARYVVQLPADAPPGRCRLEVVVTDTLAGADADATLPLEIVTATEPDAG